MTELTEITVLDGVILTGLSLDELRVIHYFRQRMVEDLRHESVEPPFDYMAVPTLEEIATL